ncbi:MAG: MFS transporter [Thermodesulfovibrionales bacterium]|nr:MFS transporter [Thermodesulfovibrionales bacterium]
MNNRHRFSSLYLRDFRVFWLSQFLSLSGTWMHSAAQSWLVYILTNSPFYLGLIATLSSLPILLFTLIGGMFADRYSKRNILIITQLLSMIPALGIAILIDLKFLTIWHIGFFAFFIGLVNAFDVPARHSFIGELVEKSDIANAIALNSVAFNGARIIGPLIAGFVITSFGLQMCFYLNAFSFLPVIFALLSIKTKGSKRTQTEGFLTDLKDASGFILSEKSILNIMLLISIFSLFGLPYITLLPVIAGEYLNVGVKGFSILLACAGIGSLFAALTIAYRGDIKHKTNYLIISAILFSFSLTIIALSKIFYLSCLCVTLAGWSVTSFLATSNIYIQHSVIDSIRGRVMSFYTLVFLGFLPIGNALAGFTANILGTSLTLKFFSLFCFICSILFSLKLKTLQRTF